MPAPAAAIRQEAPHLYLKTHGAKVARLHMVDWIVLLLLAAVALVLNSIEPFHRFVSKDTMDSSLLYPLKDNTVPIWAVAVLAVLVPVLIFAGIYVRRRNAYDLHHAILGLFFSVLITGVVTEAIKNGVGRPRPDFYWRCFPDGVPDYNNITGQVICHGDAGVIKEGHKSFPSGHTSLSFAGLGFLSWYLAGKIRAFDQGGHVAKLCIVILPLLLAAMVGVSRVDDYWHHWQDVFAGGILVSFAGLGFLSWYLAGKIRAFDRGGHVAKLCIVILPLLLAAMVGVSRVDDYWHHWQDVFAGGILGLVVASFCYLQFFPSPSGKHGHWPHAYHHHILNPEEENRMQPTTSDRDQSVLPSDLSIVPHDDSTETRSSDRALDFMEAGSRAR